MAGLLTFIPYLDRIVGIVAVMLVAALAFDDLAQMFFVGGVYWVLAILEGSFASPMILGRRLESNPVVLVLGACPSNAPLLAGQATRDVVPLPHG